MQTCYYVYHTRPTAESDVLDMLPGSATFVDYKLCVCSYNLWHMHMPDLADKSLPARSKLLHNGAGE